MLNKKLILICLAMIFIFTHVSNSEAHVPHDVVADIQLSPTFSSDKTIFSLVYWSLFKSANGGYTWHSQSKGLCHHSKISLALSPSFSVDKTLFISCLEAEVFRSQDAGQSWVCCSNQLPKLGSFIYLVTPLPSGIGCTVLALDSQGDIYQTADGGENWRSVLHQEGEITAFDCVENHVMVGTNAGILYASEDSGTTWKKYGQHPKNQKITCIELPVRFSIDSFFFIGTAKEGVMKVVDGGKTFQNANKDIEGKSITSLDSFYEAGRLILLASTWHEAIFRSEDNGATWHHYGTGLLKNKQAKEYIAPHFSKITIADDLTVFLGGFCGLFRSNDKGHSWYKLETLLDTIVGIDISPLTSAGFTVGISTYGRGIYSTIDNGASWKINNCGLINTRTGPIAYSPNYAKDKTVFAGSYNNIVKSTDSGNHWRAISVIPPKFSFEGAQFRIKNRLRRAIFESKSPLLSKLLSKLVLSWLKINIQYRPWSPLIFAISPNFSVDQTVFVGMYPQGLLRSLDGGSSFSTIWNILDSPVRSLAISPAYATDHTLFASLTNGIYRSLDGGESWEQIGGSFDLGRTALVISPDYRFDHTLFAGGLAGLFRTRDGGDTWKKLSIDNSGMNEKVSGVAISPYYAVDQQLLVQIKGGDLFICRDFEDRFEALPSTSTDSGYEFSHYHARDSAPLIKFSPNYSEDKTVFGVSVQKLLKSIDGGVTWEGIKRPLRYETEASWQQYLSLPIFSEGEWNKEYSKEYSGDWLAYSTKRNSKIRLRFVGNSVKWIGTRGPDHGVASVFIDEEFQTTVDQFSKDQEVLVELFSMNGLPHGPHEITIQVDGSRNEKSSGKRVDIDAFDVSTLLW